MTRSFVDDVSVLRNDHNDDVDGESDYDNYYCTHVFVLYLVC